MQYFRAGWQGFAIYLLSVGLSIPALSGRWLAFVLGAVMIVISTEERGE